MATTPRLAACLLLTFCFTATLVAQQQTITAQKSAVITAAAAGEKVRFSSVGATAQMRVQILAASGEVIFDSDWRDGNILDWLPQDRSGQPLSFGAYRMVMQSKNLAGQTSEKETALHLNSGGMAIDGQPGANPKITLTAHDGETGQLVTTSGDLSFRFGDFLNRKDIEAMRLTAAGELNVNGLIHAKGVMFPDGTMMTTAAGMAALGDGGSVMRQHPSAPSRGSELRPPILPMNLPTASAARLTPRPNFTPDFQFKVTDTGVNVGTTNPAYRLDVTGPINTAAQYNIGGVPFAHNFGAQNAFLGVSAGNLTMTGYDNTAIGYNALTNNIDGYRNTAGGTSALANNTSGFWNVAVGTAALYISTGGHANTAVGDSALYYDIAGGSNTAIGYGALTMTTGSDNIGIGTLAGQNLTSGNDNIEIGHFGFASESNTIRIGRSGFQTRAFMAGIYGVTTSGAATSVVIDNLGQLGTVSSSRRYKFDINSMGDATDDLMHLRPVTFRYLAHGDNAPIQYGLIAEEVAEVYPEMVTRNKDGEVETVMYQFLAPMLLNQMQKQNRTIEEQQARLDKSRQENAALRTRLERLEKAVAELKAEK